MKKKNLLLVFISTFSMLLMHQVVNAQVIYTDIPDVTIPGSGGSYALDLNNDGMIDFDLSITTQAYKSKNCGTTIVPSASISVDGQNKILTNQTTYSNTYYPTVLDLNSTISSLSTIWKGGTLDLFSHSVAKCNFYYGGEFGSGYSWTYSNQGQWYTTNDKYLGLRIRSDGNDYYGWVRLSTNSNVTIKDYAYYATPAHSIFSGQTTTEYIISSPLASNSYCSGGSIGVSYTAYGNFSVSNIFSAELSDASGSFLNPVVIGTLNSSTSGTINATIPSGTGTSSGTSYKVRVKSTVPLRRSVENNLYIYVAPQNTLIYYQTILGTPYILTTDSAFIYCGSGGLYAQSSPYCSYCPLQWKKNGINIQGVPGDSNNPLTSGDYSCAAYNSCGSAVSSVIHTIVYPCTNTQASNNQTSASKENTTLAKDFSLKIFPNPFSQSTTILFSLSQSEQVSIKIFDLSGRLVKTLANNELQQGTHQIIWDAKNTIGNVVSSGIYLVRLSAGNYSITKKLSVIK
jgi:type IX secretion system substrate protein